MTNGINQVIDGIKLFINGINRLVNGIIFRLIKGWGLGQAPATPRGGGVGGGRGGGPRTPIGPPAIN